MLERFLYPIFRRLDFRGKGRLRRILPVRAEGTAEARFPGGFRLRLDLRESLQRDFLFGLYDRRELDLVHEHLADGDFVDVGAHVGLYTVAAALDGPGRVLAFEPNPSARAQLEANVALNECANVLVVPKAVGDAPGSALLHVPKTPDPSFSSLAGGRFAEGEPIDVEVTTVDAEVEAAELRPSVVKIDVEGGELAVVGGMQRTLERHRPVLLVEVSEASARELAQTLDGYSGFRVGRRLEPLESGRGLFNALFLPQPPV
ncbi:MAG: FkbM family methyltransferase [Actinomycetota bacterium]